MTLINKLIVFLVAFFATFTNVLAYSFSVESNANYFIKYKDEIVPFKSYKLNETSELLYGISFNQELYEKNLDYVELDYANFLNVSNDTWNKIKNILYFGYLYENHTNFEWYVLTNYFLYQCINPDITIVDKNGNDIKQALKNEYEEYKKLLTDYQIAPSYFDKEIHFNYGEMVILEDTNNVEDNYHIVPSQYLRMNLTNDKRVLSAVRPTTSKVVAVKKVDNKISRIYYNKGIKLLERTMPAEIFYEATVYVHGGKIRVYNQDENNNALSGARYELYNSKNELITKLNIGNNGYEETGYLPFDEYYLVEAKASEGYLLNTEKIVVDFVDKKTIDVIINSMPIKSSVFINLYYKYVNGEKLFPEINAEFVLESENDRRFKGLTDKNGNLSFFVPIGNYTLRQISSPSNFLLIEKQIMVTENDDIIINKVNTFDKYIFNIEFETEINYDLIKELSLCNENNCIKVEDYIIENNTIILKGGLNYGHYTINISAINKNKDINFKQDFDIDENTQYINYLKADISNDPHNDKEIISSENKEKQDELEYIVEVPQTSKNALYFLLIISLIIIFTGFKLSLND